LYAEGRGVPRDDREALRWYRAAAEQGHRDAQNALGSMHERGRGVRQDLGEAARLYRAAAGAGDAAAQLNLSRLLEDGRGLARDDAEAARWLRSAAEQEHAPALARLAELQAEGGGGIARDPPAAAESYYRAGLAYLKDGRKDEARRCAEALRRLEGVGSAAGTPRPLAESLLAAIASP
ncbi:MAG TPA: tetratricopeptide repeat protein, partial [Vicinamibacteria bacterium]